MFWLHETSIHFNFSATVSFYESWKIFLFSRLKRPEIISLCWSYLFWYGMQVGRACVCVSQYSVSLLVCCDEQKYQIFFFVIILNAFICYIPLNTTFILSYLPPHNTFISTQMIKYFINVIDVFKKKIYNRRPIALREYR